jgi:hypothetical protein
MEALLEAEPVHYAIDNDGKESIRFILSRRILGFERHVQNLEEFGVFENRDWNLGIKSQRTAREISRGIDSGEFNRSQDKRLE